MIDTHLHLASPEFRNDIAETINRAGEAGVRYLITIGSGYGADNFDSTIEIAGRFGLFYALGVHPHDADLGVQDRNEYRQRLDRIFGRIRRESSDSKMVAIGEIGLDFYYNHSPQNIQKDTFADFLGFASEMNLPVIIHSRDSFKETVDIIRSAGKKIRGVFHCFSGDREQAKTVLDMGFYISIPGIVTFKKATEMQEVARFLPDDRILIETDAPFLAPVPYRGKRNEPAYIAETYKFVSALRGTGIERLSDTVLNNAFRCFGIRKDDIIDSTQG